MSIQAAAAGLKTGPGTIGYVMLKSLKSEQSVAALMAAATSAGYKPSSIYVFLDKAVNLGVLQKTPTGGFVLAGGGLGQPEAPKPGTSITLPNVPPQPAQGLEQIRNLYPADHPIQKLQPHHAQRYHDLMGWYEENLDPKVNTKLGNIVEGKRELKHYLEAGDSLMDNYSAITMLACAAFWKGSSSSPGGAILGQTIHQMGINGAPVSSGAPKMKAGEGMSPKSKSALSTFGLDSDSYQGATHKSVSGVTVFVHTTDPDALSMMEIPKHKYPTTKDVAADFGVPEQDVVLSKITNNYYVKGPSRAEMVMNQHVMTQIAMKKMGINKMSIYRGVHDKGYSTIVKTMMDDATAQEPGGKGAKVLLNPVSSWSTSHVTAANSNFGNLSGYGDSAGVVFTKASAPAHTILVHHKHHISSNKLVTDDVFSGFGESEVIAIGHASSSIAPVERKKYVKVSQLKVLDRPKPNLQLPPGWGDVVALTDGRYYWVTRDEVQLVIFVDDFDGKPNRQSMTTKVANLSNVFSLPLSLLTQEVVDDVG